MKTDNAIDLHEILGPCVKASMYNKECIHPPYIIPYSIDP
jgi:hypothetical protein